MTSHVLPKQVLVVDKETVTRVALVEAMEGHGNAPSAGSRLQSSDVDWAGDWNTARAMLRKKTYSMVLLDRQMPGIISSDFARLVRRISPGTRLVLMGESDVAGLRDLAAHSGFDGCLCKPFTVRAVCDVMADLEQPAGQPTTAGVRSALLDEERVTRTWGDDVTRTIGQGDDRPGPAGRGQPLDQTLRPSAETPSQGRGPVTPFRGGSPGTAAESPLLGAQPPATQATASAGSLPSSARQSLEALCADTRAHCVMLITSSGYPVDAVGQTGGLHLPTLGALIAANFAAAAELSRRLGNPSDFRASHYQGPDWHIYAYKASQELLLAVIFGAESRAGAVWLFAKRAAAVLAAQPTSQPPASEPAQRPEVARADSDLGTQMEAQWADLLGTEAEPGPTGPATPGQDAH